MKKRVLLVSDATFLSSGYGVYGKSLMSRLYKMGDFELAELSQYAEPNDPRLKEVPWKCYGNLPHSGNEKEKQVYESDIYNQFGKWKLEEVCLDFKVDCILTLNDYWMSSHIAQSPFRKFFNHIWLVACDSIPQNQEWIDAYMRTDAIFTYSDWAVDVLKEQSNGQMNVLGAVPPATPECFLPAEDKGKYRRALGIGENVKIIGFVARLQRRKLFPDLFKSIRMLIDQTSHKDVLLYCHTSFPDNSGWDIPQLLNEHGLNNRVLFTYVCKNCGHAFPSFFADAISPCIKCGQITAGMSSVQHGVSSEVLASIYNLMDIYIQIANSEGFGISMVEAAACSVPIAAVDYSAMHSVIRQLNGYPIKVQSLYKELETGCMRAVPDNQDLVRILDEFFNLPKALRLKKSWETRQAFLKNFNWDETAAKWANAINSFDLSPDRWSSPPQIHQPLAFEQINQELSNQQYVDILMDRVLCQPELKGSYLSKRLLRDINYGMSVNGLLGASYFNESSQAFERLKHEPFNRKKAHDEMLGECLKNNFWENERGKRNA